MLESLLPEEDGAQPHYPHLHCGGHAPPHPHDDLHETSRRSAIALRWVFLLTFVYLIVEVLGGWIAGSLALLADGFHMFADAGAIGISLFAQWYAHRPAPEYRTFGYQRLEVLAAFVNALSLMIMSLFIIWESIQRFQSPVAVHSSVMLPIAVGGLLINILSLRLLHGDHHHNLNVKGAYLHILSDLLGSVGAIVAGLLVFFFHWNLADPILSLVIAGLILANAFGLLRDASNILLEGCPSHISIDAIREKIMTFEGVHEVHHLHVWSINLRRVVLTAHLVVSPEAFSGEMLMKTRDVLKQQFDLSHVTLQLEEIN